jgi:dolichol-phosphate mannosyltransferase
MRRILTSRVANYIAHVLLSPGVSDLTGSFRIYKKNVLSQLIKATTAKGYVFQMEMMVRGITTTIRYFIYIHYTVDPNMR